MGTFLVVFLWAYLISTGNISTIWPMFGAANQLLGMLALCVGTTLIILMNKKKYIWITLVPMLFMAATNFTAVFYMTQKFWSQAAHAATPAEAFSYYLNIFLILLIATLAVIILTDATRKWVEYLILNKPLKSTEVGPDYYKPDTDLCC